jgi:hypothetical protein
MGVFRRYLGRLVGSGYLGGTERSLLEVHGTRVVLKYENPRFLRNYHVGVLL